MDKTKLGLWISKDSGEGSIAIELMFAPKSVSERRTEDWCGEDSANDLLTDRWLADHFLFLLTTVHTIWN